jgi:hypothetical protein
VLGRRAAAVDALSARRFAAGAREALSGADAAAAAVARGAAAFQWAERAVVAGEALLARLPGQPALAARLLADALGSRGAPGGSSPGGGGGGGGRGFSGQGLGPAAGADCGGGAAAAQARSEQDPGRPDPACAAPEAPAWPDAPAHPDPGPSPVAPGVEVTDRAERALLDGLMRRAASASGGAGSGRDSGGDDDADDAVGWGAPAQAEWLLECAGGGPTAALAAAGAAAAGAGDELRPGAAAPHGARRQAEKGGEPGTLCGGGGAWGAAWAPRHRLYVRTRRGEMRLATVIVAEP